jgi:hypothetical protein
MKQALTSPIGDVWGLQSEMFGISDWRCLGRIRRSQV